jgi:putative peptidoglycan lipid II flippase
MRVYSAGLLGHMLVGALVRCYFAAARPLWFPAIAMVTGLVVNTAAGVLLVREWGVLGIAAANAVGITVAAALLLVRVGRHSVPVRTRYLTWVLVRLTVAATAATGTGWLCGTLVPSAALAVVGAFPLVAAVFLAIAKLLRAPELDSLLRPVTRRLIHDS